jgi:hypothetical protein
VVYCPEPTIAVSRGCAAEEVRRAANHQMVGDQTEGTERTKATQVVAALFPLSPLSPGVQTEAVVMGGLLSGAAPDVCVRIIPRPQMPSHGPGLSIRRRVAGLPRSAFGHTPKTQAATAGEQKAGLPFLLFPSTTFPGRAGRSSASGIVIRTPGCIPQQRRPNAGCPIALLLSTS